MIFKRLKQRKEYEKTAALLYSAAVDQARKPGFYQGLGVPDNLDGRFELICLHAFLVLNRIKGAGERATGVSRELYDIFFADMDRCLREMGAGDLGVGHKVQRMAEGFFGRLQAYDAACEAKGGEAEGVETKDGEDLSEVLRRNLYGTLDKAEERWIVAMTSYVLAARTGLASQSLDDVLSGDVRFAALPSY